MDDMSTAIRLSSQKRLLRLISARTDMQYASDGFRRFVETKDEGTRHQLFLVMVVAYCRPFTENYGIGSLLCEYPVFPDFPDADMNLRHKRFIDLRNNFLSHSSIEGTKVHLLAPGAISPASGGTAVGYGYAVEKLVFSEEPAFVSGLHDLVVRLSRRLDDDMKVAATKVGSSYLLDSGKFMPLSPVERD